jgi:ankyrin repeat protein
VPASSLKGSLSFIYAFFKFGSQNLGEIMKNFKNILITLSLLVSLQAFAAEAPIPHPTQSTTLSGGPTDIKLIITRLLTNFKNYDDAINAINALYQTDKRFRRLVDTNSQALFTEIANNYACLLKEEIAQDLKIASIRNLSQSKEDNWLKKAIAEDESARQGAGSAIYETPLYQAIRQDNLTQVKNLVADSADFKKIATEAIALRPVGMLPTNEKTLQIVQFFLEKGLDPHCLGWALVNYAGSATQVRTKEEKDLEILKLLITNGVNVNYKRGGDTALLWATATAKGYTPQATLATVTYLLEHGANPNIKHRHLHQTALDFAEENRLYNIIPLLQRYGAKHGNELP